MSDFEHAVRRLKYRNRARQSLELYEMMQVFSFYQHSSPMQDPYFV